MKKLITTIILIASTVLNTIPAFADIKRNADIDTTKQTLTVADIQKVLDKIPTCYTKGLDIYLMDTTSTKNASAMAGYFWNTSRINIYRTDVHEGKQVFWSTYKGLKVVHVEMKEEINHVLAHEVGHHINNKIEKDYFEGYVNIYKSRKERIFEMDIQEDFAEAFNMYILDIENFQKHCPARYVYFEMVTLKLLKNQYN